MSARLVAPEALAARLGAPGLVVVDATVVLDKPPGGGPYTVRSGLPGFTAAHVPGARHADVARDLSAPGAPRPFTWPAPAQVAAAAAALGIGDGTEVVVYAQEGPMWATRLWLVLHAHGLEDVAVLDGGLRAWRAASLPVQAGPPAAAAPAPAAAPLTPRLRPGLLATRDDVLAALDDGATCVVNALRPPVFRGEEPTAYTRPGRIPGSVNVPHVDLTDPATGRFLPVAALRERFAALGDGPVLAYCGGGVSATVVVFALALAGREDVRLYDGSLAEWSADPALPLVTG